MRGHTTRRSYTGASFVALPQIPPRNVNWFKKANGYIGPKLRLNHIVEGVILLGRPGQYVDFLTMQIRHGPKHGVFQDQN